MNKGNISTWTANRGDVDADADADADNDGVNDHQLGFYQGELKRIIARRDRLHAAIFAKHGSLSLEIGTYKMGREVIRSFLSGRLWDKLQR